MGEQHHADTLGRAKARLQVWTNMKLSMRMLAGETRTAFLRGEDSPTAMNTCRVRCSTAPRHLKPLYRAPSIQKGESQQTTNIQQLTHEHGPGTSFRERLVKELPLNFPVYTR